MRGKLSEYKHHINIKIRYDDLDTFGHVNNKAYLAYLEEARIDFHKKIFCWKKTLEFNAVVAKIEINYLKPILLNDKLSVYTKLNNVGNKSFELESIFCIKSNEKEEIIIVANSRVVLVSVEPKTGKPTRIPDEEREKLLDFKCL